MTASIERIVTALRDLGLGPLWATPLAYTAGVLGIVVLAGIANWVARRVILRLVGHVVERSSARWDDVFLRAGVFTRLSHVAPAGVVALVGRKLFANNEAWLSAIRTSVNVYLIIIMLMVLNAAATAAVELYEQSATTRWVPVKGFVQGLQLVAFLYGVVLVLSVLLGRSPWYFLSGLGALTAVLLLIFKDALLGLVAGVQISVGRLVQIGDWIEMPKYGADGDVIDVGLTVVKVRNWDKTITTVPTYALTSEPVKNWRGMHESGGRRIKRAIYLDMESFRFVDDQLLGKLLTFRRLRPHFEQKLPELAEHNRREGVDPARSIEARRLTNVGCFRAYVLAYLREHPQINQDMTLLVRQLAPAEKGLPLEVYAFTNDTRWAVYEGVQSDIFDHLLTVVPEFGLRVYQAPTGHDLRSLREERAEAPLPARAPGPERS